MAYTTIKKPSDYFNTKLYTGNNADGHAITGINFQPDFLWIKARNTTYSHRLYDSIRGVNSAIISDSTAAENQYVEFGQLESFDSDGFTVGIGSISGAGTNDGNNYVAWNWLGANGTASNTDGSITSTVSANTTSGFSIVAWTGDGSNSATVGHGLGSELACIIIKERNGSDWWHVWNKGLSGNDYNVFINNTEAERSPVSDGHVKKLDNTTTFGFATTGNVNAVNQSGITNIAYCFAEKQGFSKFGSYVGNGNADGTFVYTGFKPMWILLKRTDSANGWYLYDSVRDPENQNTKALIPSGSDAEQNESGIDLLSNGFKLRNADGSKNASGGTYIYMAFAEEPLVGDNPATAR